MNDTFIDSYDDDDHHLHHHPNATLPPSQLLVPEYVESPFKTALFFLFGLFMFCILFYLARTYDIQHRREQEALVQRQQQSEVEDVKSKEGLRNRLIQSMNQKNLTKTLTYSDIETVASSTASDIEEGMKGEGKDKMPPGIPEDAFVKRTQASRENNVAAEPSSKSDVDETENDEIKYQKSPLPENDNTKVPDLDLETGREVKIAGMSDDTYPVSARSETEDSPANGSMMSEMIVTRVGNPLSLGNECAICLECYNEGDTVVWSGNSSCQHVFHQQCILDYLVQKNDEECPCPCCRQIFLPKDRWKAT